MKMANTHILVVCSQKGGVGKTAISVNLSVTLREEGYKVLLVDTDYSNPSVGFHLGMQDANIGVQSVIEGRATLKEAIAIHAPSGLHVLPGELTAKMPQFTEEGIRSLAESLGESGYEFAILDSAPGPMSRDAMEELGVLNALQLIVLTPEMSATSSAMRLAQIYKTSHLSYAFIANRVAGRRYELRVGEIEDALGEEMLATLPEDVNVPISVAAHIPLAIYNAKSPFAAEVKKLSKRLITKSGVGEAEHPEIAEGAARAGFFAKLRGFFSRIFKRS